MRVKQLMVQAVKGGPFTVVAAAAIFGIPDDGVADAGQLYSDLVAAAGAEFDGDETGCSLDRKSVV